MSEKQKTLARDTKRTPKSIMLSRQWSTHEIDDATVFVIERPSKLNTVTSAVLDALNGCLDRLEANGCGLLVITGLGERAFCAGTDLAELHSLTPEGKVSKCDLSRKLMLRLSRSPVVSVAAVNGLALGAGMEIAMSCTLRIAVPNAGFALPEIKLGLLPAYAGTQMLPALIGAGRALEIMLTGRTVSAEEALTIGLIHRIASGQPIEEAAIAFGREVVCNSPGAVGAIRRCVDVWARCGVEAGLEAERHAVTEVFASTDAVEGISAFLEKRPA